MGDRSFRPFFRPRGEQKAKNKQHRSENIKQVPLLRLLLSEEKRSFQFSFSIEFQSWLS